MIKQLVSVKFTTKPDKEMNDIFLYTDYVNTLKDYEEILVEADVAYKYQGNFYGLLYELNVPQHLYVLTMYVNRLDNPIDYDGKPGTIKIARDLPIPKH